MAETTSREETDEFLPVFNADGLIPCVTVDARSGAVLMMAWMNMDALRQTIETRVAHYWSRSRQTLWEKGETSGNTLALEGMRVDCDGDALLVRAAPAGPTCHTGTTSSSFAR